MILFRVIRPYKGNLGEFVELYDGSTGTDCSFGEPKPGTRFFVYGFRDQDGKINFHACSRTMLVDYAAPDIRFARGEPATREDLAPPGEKWRLRLDPTLETRGATVSGVVRRADGGDVSGVFVTLWEGENGRRIGAIGAVQKVSANGSFEIRYLRPGLYNLTAEDSRPSPTARYLGEYGNITLSEYKFLSNLVVPLHAEPLGSVSVQVIAPPEVHDRMVISLHAANTDSTEDVVDSYRDTLTPDKRSTALFEHVPYGLYELKVMVTDGSSFDTSWMHNNVQIRVNDSHAHVTVELHRR